MAKQQDVRRIALEVYRFAADHALARNIIIADTKFEFGWHRGELLLGDEVLTPDSSRYWPRDTYQPGGAQKSFDKQFVRDYLETLTWNKQPPAPALPLAPPLPEVLASARSVEAPPVDVEASALGPGFESAVQP